MEQTQSESIDELAKAMVKLQLGLPGAKAMSTNFYKKNYANLKDCLEAGREILSENGLCVLQTFGGCADSPSVITTLMHVSGQWIKGEGHMTPDKKGPQGTGSAITYARRYGYSAIIGLHQEDDDAEGATDRKNKQAPKDTSKAGVDGSKLNPVIQPHEISPAEVGDDPPELDYDADPKITKGKAKILYAKLMNVPKWVEEDRIVFLEDIGFDSVYDVTEEKYEGIKQTLTTLSQKK